MAKKTTTPISSMAIPPVRRVPAEDVPEVLEFVRLRDAFDSYREQHADVFREIARFEAAWTTTAKAAAQAVKSKGVECGPFVYHRQPKFEIDPEGLFKLVGSDADVFTALGGTIEQRPHYAIPDDVVIRMIAHGEIPPEDVHKVAELKASYKSVPAFAIPPMGDREP